MATEDSRNFGREAQGGVIAQGADAPVLGAVLPATSARMSRQARRDTAPELELRRELHRLGLRYRVDHPLPGMPRRRADVLFPRAKVAVFVDGCFWHACPVHGTAPTNNGQWWADKLARNVVRDRDTDAQLDAAGWTVVRIWEHQNMSHAATDISRLLSSGTKGDVMPGESKPR